MADDDKGGKADHTFTQAQVDDMVAGLKTKNGELLGKVKDFGDRIKAFDGLDPAKAREAIADAEKVEAEAAKARGNWDAREKALREQFAAAHGAEMDPLKTKVTQLETDLFDAVAVRDALEAMGDKDVKANPKLAMPLLRHELGVEMIGGVRVTVVRGPDGKPRYHPTTNKLLSPRDRLLELRSMPEYGGAFEGAGGSGGGALGGTGAPSSGTVTLTRAEASDMQVYDAALKQVGGDYTKLKIVAQ